MQSFYYGQETGLKEKNRLLMKSVFFFLFREFEKKNVTPFE